MHCGFGSAEAKGSGSGSTTQASGKECAMIAGGGGGGERREWKGFGIFQTFSPDILVRIRILVSILDLDYRIWIQLRSLTNTYLPTSYIFQPVLRIRIRMFLGRLNPDPNLICHVLKQSLGSQENPLCLQLVEFISQEVDRLGVGLELLVRGAAGRLHLRSRQNGNSRLYPL